MCLSTHERCWELVTPIYKHLFVLTYSHLCFNVGLPPSFSLTEQQYPVCYWSNIMIKGAVCRTKNRPAIQLCYPAVHRSRQVVSFLQDDFGKSIPTSEFMRRCMCAASRNSKPSRECEADEFERQRFLRRIFTMLEIPSKSIIRENIGPECTSFGYHLGQEHRTQ